VETAAAAGKGRRATQNGPVQRWLLLPPSPERACGRLPSTTAKMRKKVDQRIRTLVENSVKLHQRSMFVIVGDRGRDQARAAAPCGSAQQCVA
jgi:hypothetical protein